MRIMHVLDQLAHQYTLYLVGPKKIAPGPGHWEHSIVQFEPHAISSLIQMMIQRELIQQCGIAQKKQETTKRAQKKECSPDGKLFHCGCLWRSLGLARYREPWIHEIQLFYNLAYQYH